ncbi:MAG: choice-of-anchor R domain-containing protein [archaeon]
MDKTLAKILMLTSILLFAGMTSAAYADIADICGISNTNLPLDSLYEGLIGTYDDQDWWEFTLPKSGDLKVDFYSTGGSTLYMGIWSTCDESSEFLSVGTSSYATRDISNLDAGTYKLIAMGSPGNVGNYRIKLTFEPDEDEEEQNPGTSDCYSAPSMTLGRNMLSSVPNGDCDTYKGYGDWHKIVIPEDGDYDINLYVDRQNTWLMQFYKDDYKGGCDGVQVNTPITYFTTEWENDEIGFGVFKTKNLKSGTYYIRVCEDEPPFYQDWYTLYIGEAQPSIVCGDGICSAEENCGSDKSACGSNLCYQPTCSWGCAQIQIPEGQEDPKGCTGNNYCDGYGNCVAKPVDECMQGALDCKDTATLRSCQMQANGYTKWIEQPCGSGYTCENSACVKDEPKDECQYDIDCAHNYACAYENQFASGLMTQEVQAKSCILDPVKKNQMEKGRAAWVYWNREIDKEKKHKEDIEAYNKDVSDDLKIKYIFAGGYNRYGSYGEDIKKYSWVERADEQEYENTLTQDYRDMFPKEEGFKLYVMVDGYTTSESDICDWDNDKIEYVANYTAYAINNDENVDGVHLDIEYDMFRDAGISIGATQQCSENLGKLITSLKRKTNKTVSAAIGNSLVFPNLLEEGGYPWTNLNDQVFDADFLALMNYDIAWTKDLTEPLDSIIDALWRGDYESIPFFNFCNLYGDDDEYSATAREVARSFLHMANEKNTPVMIGLPAISTQHEFEQRARIGSGEITYSGSKMTEYLRGGLEAVDYALDTEGSDNFLGISLWAFMSYENIDVSGNEPPCGWFFYYPRHISEEAWNLLKGLDTEVTGTISPGEVKYNNIDVSGIVDSIKLSLKWPGSDLDLVLYDPNGNKIDPLVASQNDSVEYFEGETNEDYTIKSPMAGKWTAEVTAVDVHEDEPYSLTLDNTVKTFSDSSAEKLFEFPTSPQSAYVELPANAEVKSAVMDIEGLAVGVAQESAEVKNDNVGELTHGIYFGAQNGPGYWVDYKAAQSFTLGEDSNLESVDAYIKRHEIYTGASSVLASIQADSGGLPSGSKIAQVTLPAFDNFEYAWKNIAFDEAVALQKGTTYWLVLEYSGGSGSRGYMLGYDANGDYPNGRVEFYDEYSGGWNIPNPDLSQADGFFKLHLKGENAEVEQYVENPSVSISEDVIWTHSGEFSGKETTHDFANVLNSELSGCGEETCQIELAFSALGTGKLRVSNLNIIYTVPEPEPPIDSTPFVKIGYPFEGSTVNKATLRILGHASDEDGLASVSLNVLSEMPLGNSVSSVELPTSVDFYEKFSEISLQEGKNTITVTAEDSLGNVGQDSVVVYYEKTVVPNYVIDFTGKVGIDTLASENYDGNTLVDYLHSSDTKGYLYVEGKEYRWQETVEIDLDGVKIARDNLETNWGDQYDEVFMSISGSTIKYVNDFTPVVDYEGLVGNKIWFMTMEFTVINASEDVLKLASRNAEVVLTTSNPTTTVSGIDVSLGGVYATGVDNAYKAKVIVTNKGFTEAKYVAPGTIETIAGVEIYVKNAVVTTSGTNEGEVQLVVGAGIMVLENGGYLMLGDGTETTWQVDLVGSSDTLSKIVAKDVQSRVTVYTTDPVLYPGDSIAMPNGIMSFTYNGLKDSDGNDVAYVNVDIMQTTRDLGEGSVNTIRVRTQDGDYVSCKHNGNEMLANEAWLDINTELWYAKDPSAQTLKYAEVDEVKIKTSKSAFSLGYDNEKLTLTEPDGNKIIAEQNGVEFWDSDSDEMGCFVYYNEQTSAGCIHTTADVPPAARDYYTKYGTYIDASGQSMVSLLVPESQTYGEFLLINNVKNLEEHKAVILQRGEEIEEEPEEVIQPPAPSQSPSPGASSGGSSGGGSSGPAEVAMDISNGPAEYTMGKGSVGAFQIAGEKHTVTIDEVGTDWAKVTIRSDPVERVLKVSEVAYVDVNNDNEDDLAVVLKGIENGKAKLQFYKIEGVVEKIVEISDESVFAEEDESSKASGLATLGNAEIGALFAGLFAVAAIGYFGRKKGLI